MSNELTLFQGSAVPAFLQGAVDNLATSLGGGSGARRISIKGGVFREYIGSVESRVSEERSLNVIILTAAPHIHRTYYEGTYVEGENASPVCWSSDSERPDPKATKAQSDKCLSCPQNVKGSGQGESRACRFSQRLAVALDGELDKKEVYQLVLPSTSVFGDADNKKKMSLQAYVRFLNGHNTPSFGVVTEMRFDIDSPTPKLVFNAVRHITAEEYEIVRELREAPAAIKAITLSVAEKTDSNKGFETAAPKTKNVLAAPKKEAAPAPAEEVAEPKVTSAKKAEPVAEDASLSGLVDSWDD